MQMCVSNNGTVVKYSMHITVYSLLGMYNILSAYIIMYNIYSGF